MRRRIISRLSLVAGIALASPVAQAQDIHFTQFDMQPLIINPAFTGMFDGQVRAGGIYRTQWQNVTNAYRTYGVYADVPLFIERNGDYLASGFQLYNDVAGDGNLKNFTGLVSVAYHKFFGKTDWSGADLAVGLQAGYAQKSIDLSKLYFGDEFVNSTFVPGTSSEYQLGLGNSINYYLVNAGVCFSQATSEKFGYTLGVGANNLNQPNDAIQKKQNSQVGLDMRYTVQAGANWVAGQRLTLRPAVLYQMQSSASEIIAGNEFRYEVGSAPGFQDFSTALFIGGWYRTGDAAMITAGMEFKGFRIGIAYDYNMSGLNSSTNGFGGLEFAVKYVAPNPLKFAHKRTIPCARF